MKFTTMRDFFAQAFRLSAKHDHYADFGYPDTVTFEHLYKLYCRNDLASAAVKKTTEKTFQNLPEIVAGDDDEPIAEVGEAFERLGLWDKLADIDEYAQVSGYAGFVIRVRDNKRFNEPLEGSFSLDDIVEIIPAWSEQLKVSEWHLDESDADNYGKPKTFTFNESAMDHEGANRSVVVHPSRVFIWSADGTTKAPSSLLSGVNNLIDMEKISGAGGEGFWKTAAARMNIRIDKDTDFTDFQNAVEKQSGKKFQDALDEKVKKLNEGFDKAFVTQGTEVDNFTISLPQPKEFFEIPLMAYAAGRSIPLKILVGSQSGERASTEDANEWNNTIMARRNRWCIPGIRSLLQWMEAFGMIKAGWSIKWDSLSDDTPKSKLDRAKTMADINTSQTLIDDQPIFSGEEIRVEAGHDEDLPDVTPRDDDFDDEPNDPDPDPDEQDE